MNPSGPEPYLVSLNAMPRPLEWAAVFERSRPVEVEVGSGKGGFVIASAEADPDCNFLGIEVARTYARYTAERMAKRGLDNARVLAADARVVFGWYLPAASVRAVHVYFPDPWWKRRHKKRRVFTAGFVAGVARVLTPGGRLLIRTDVEEYFAVMQDLIRNQAGLRPGAASEAPTRPLTNFERKYAARGKPIYGAVYVRADGCGLPHPG